MKAYLERVQLGGLERVFEVLRQILTFEIRDFSHKACRFKCSKLPIEYCSCISYADFRAAR